jgi:hypothetical protein
MCPRERFRVSLSRQGAPGYYFFPLLYAASSPFCSAFFNFLGPRPSPRYAIPPYLILKGLREGLIPFAIRYAYLHTFPAQIEQVFRAERRECGGLIPPQ